MFPRFLPLSACALLLCSVGYGQNINNSVIFNTVVVPAPVEQPIYLPEVPTYTGPNEFDRAQAKSAREAQLREAQLASAPNPYYVKPELSLLEEIRYQNCPRYRTTQVVNLRNAGGGKGAVVGKLPKGALVIRKLKIDDLSGWMEVHLPGRNGTFFVAERLLEPSF